MPLLGETALSNVRLVIIRGLIEVLFLPLPLLLDDVHRWQVLDDSLTSGRFFEIYQAHVMDLHF